MRKEIKKPYLIVFFAAILMLMSTIPGGMANGNGIPAQLRLEAIPGTYVESSEDAWLNESYVTTNTSFDLNITYNQSQKGNISYLYLLVAVNMTPSGNVTVNVSGNTVGPYDGVIKNNKALVNDTEPDYEYPGHGIYKNGSSTCFEVVNITSLIPGGTLVGDETMTVHIDINPINPVKVHFDAVGADSNKAPIAFVPPSHDVTYDYVPEFTTIAIPVAAVLGLLFFFNHRKKRRE
ncbi:MAG: choice-of-anchor N protein [Halobacteriota archaeon]